ncbi:MAG: hypothetical protein AAGJ40_17420 [Planctomycetota bacterium]
MLHRAMAFGILVASAISQCPWAQVGYGDDLRAKDKLPGSIAESIADCERLESDFDRFLAATSVPAISPVYRSATARDLVVRCDTMVSPRQMVAVVQKPNRYGATYQIPVPEKFEHVYKFLKDHLGAAAEQGAAIIRFPKRHHFLIRPLVQGGRHLKLEGLTDCTIDFNDSLLEFSQVSPGIVIEDCARVQLINGTIRGASQIASIGRPVDSGDSSGRIGFEVLPEFRRQIKPSPVSGEAPLLTVGRAKHAPGFGWLINSAGYFEWFVNREPRLNRFRFDESSGRFMPMGQQVEPVGLDPEAEAVWLLHENNAGHALLLDNEEKRGVEDLSLVDLRFQNIPGRVVAGQIQRGLHVSECRFERNPTDPHAIFAVASDTIHINAAEGDIVIEKSTFDASLDDKINIKANYWKITEVNSIEHTIVVEPAGRSTSLHRWGTAAQEGIVTDHELNIVAKFRLSETSIRENGKRHRLKIDGRPDVAWRGKLIANTDTAGARIVIRENLFRDTRSQAVLVQASHVLVQANRFERIAGPAVKIHFGLNDWFESIAPRNIVIEDNRFGDCAFAPSKPSKAILLQQTGRDGRPISLIRDVRILGNKSLWSSVASR